MQDLPTIEQRILALKEYPPKELDAEVRRVLTPPTDNAITLEARAILVTGLRKAKLWPLQ